MRRVRAGRTPTGAPGESEVQGAPAPATTTPATPGRVSNRQIARNYAQQVLFRGLGMIASVLTVSITTRYMGPEYYGALTTAVMFVGLWTSLTELGVGSVIVRRVMSGTGDLERMVRVNAGMSALFCLPIFGLTALAGALVYHSNAEIVDMILIISISLILTTITSCFEPIFLVTVRFGSVAWSDLVSRICSLGATALLVHFQAGTVWFAIVQLVPPIVILVIQGFAASRIANWWPVFSASETLSLLREALPLTAMLVIGVLYWRADGVILSLTSTTDQVGIYGLAYTLAFTLTAVATFFQSSTLSTMVHSFSQDLNAFGAFAGRSMEAMLFIAAPIAILGTVLSEPIIALVGSSSFVADGGPTVALLFWAMALTFLTGVLSLALFASHDQTFLWRLSLFNLALNIGLNIFLAPRYGAIGAGIALVITEGVGLVAASWRLTRRTPYRTPWLFALRLTLPVAAATAIVLLLRDVNIIVALLTSGVGYLAVNLVIGPATPSVVKSLVSKKDDEDSLRQEEADAADGAVSHER